MIADGGDATDRSHRRQTSITLSLLVKVDVILAHAPEHNVNSILVMVIIVVAVSMVLIMEASSPGNQW
jgi:hypothetical protein